MATIPVLEQVAETLTTARDLAEHARVLLGTDSSVRRADLRQARESLEAARNDVLGRIADLRHRLTADEERPR